MRNFTTLLILFVNTVVLHSQNCFPDGIMFNRQTQIDSFASSFPECINILGSVKVDEFEGDPITSIAGLSQIKNIGGDLEITNNKALENLFGLNELKNLNGNLLIRNNEKLQSMEAFASLQKIGGSLQISENDSLQNLNGLQGIKSLDNFVFISSNGNLNKLQGLDSLTLVKAEFRIHQNKKLSNLNGLENLKEVAAMAIDSNITLKNIDALMGLNSVLGPLRIRYCNELTNANFQSLTSIEGDILIRSNARLEALNFTGISSLMGSLELIDNIQLNSLSGLQNINNIGGDLIINAVAVPQLDGLNACTSVGGDLKVINNQLLTSIAAIQNISSVGGVLGVGNNENLESLNGINNIIILKDSLIIFDNTKIQSLAGIADMDLSQVKYLLIQSNNHLTTCNVPSICEYIQNNASNTSINNNDTQCNSIEQVEFKCTTAIDDERLTQISIFPNPCDQQLWVKGVAEIHDITIYNLLGQLVQKIDHWTTSQYIDTNNLERGMYFIKSSNGLTISFTKI